MPVNFIPEGFHAVTPYPVVQDAQGLIDFLKHTFAAQEIFRAIGSAGGIHAVVRIGDSMMMIGGGGPGLTWRGESRPMAFHVYVRDTDATYRSALEHGGASLQEPVDQDWGERTANVKDPFGNNWYIATFRGENYFSDGAPTVQPYLHPVGAGAAMDFLTRAFGATEEGRASSPEGIILHTTLKIGGAALEMSEADGIYQPMPGMFYFYVPDADTAYRRALEAGATSISEPADQSYGDRSAGVKDTLGNLWYFATPKLDARA